MKNKIRKFILNIVSKIYPDKTANIRLELQRRATRDTCDFIEENMNTITSVDNWKSVIDLGLKNVIIEGGLYLEFGVFSGNTINYIASNINENVYGFDSFQGLPQFWRDGFNAGHFSLNRLPSVKSNVILIKGWFDISLPEFLTNIYDNEKKVSFLHIDCDLYSSTKTIFDLLKGRIVPGTVIVFDEFFNYHGWQEGEFKAFFEFIAETGLSYKYLTYNYTHEQVAVIIV